MERTLKILTFIGIYFSIYLLMVIYDVDISFYIGFVVLSLLFICLTSFKFVKKKEKFRNLVSMMDEEEVCQYFMSLGEKCVFSENRKDIGKTYSIYRLVSKNRNGNRFIGFTCNNHTSEWYENDFVTIYF